MGYNTVTVDEIPSEYNGCPCACVKPCPTFRFGWSWANIYGSSVGWLENTRMSTQPICYLYWKELTKHALVQNHSTLQIMTIARFFPKYNMGLK